MTLRDLIDQVNHYPGGRMRERILDQEIMVHTSEPSMGPRSMVSVACGAPGFDWETKYFVLEVEPTVIRGNKLASRPIR